MNIKQWFITKLGVLGQFLSVLFKTTVQKELEVVLPLAALAVAQIEADPTLILPGAKRDAAIASIVSSLTNSQIKIGLSVVSLGVELAVQAANQASK